MTLPGAHVRVQLCSDLYKCLVVKAQWCVKPMITIDDMIGRPFHVEIPQLVCLARCGTLRLPGIGPGKEAG